MKTKDQVIAEFAKDINRPHNLLKVRKCTIDQAVLEDFVTNCANASIHIPDELFESIRKAFRGVK